MEKLLVAFGALLALTAQSLPADYPLASGLSVSPGDTVSLAQKIPSLRANGSDRFALPDGSTAKLVQSNGRPLRFLRYLGARGGRHYYAASVDGVATLPPPPPTPEALVKTPVKMPSVNGCVAHFKTTVRDRVLPPTAAIGCYRAVETATGANAERLTIAGLKARDLERDGIRLRGVRDVIIEDFDLRHSAVPSEGTHLPEGIAIGGDGYDGGNLIIRRGVISGFRMLPQINPKTGKARYTNGDGIAIEGGIDGVLIEDVVIEDSTDGGVDTKSTNTRIDRVTVRNVNRAFRIWKDLDGGTLTAENFAGAAIWAGEGAQVHVRKLIARTAKPGIVFRLESNARIVVDDCDFSGMATGSTLTKADGGGASVKLGSNCKLP